MITLELKKPLPNVVATDVERTQESDKANDGSDVRNEENLVEDVLELNDESDAHLEPFRFHPQYGVEGIDHLKD